MQHLSPHICNAMMCNTVMVCYAKCAAPFAGHPKCDAMQAAQASNGLVDGDAHMGMHIAVHAPERAGQME